MVWKRFCTPSGSKGIDKKQQLIDSVSYEDFMKFQKDYESKMERGEV